MTCCSISLGSVSPFATMTVFRPPGLGRSSQDFAPFRWTHPAPSGGGEAERCAFDRSWRELSAGNVNEFQRQVEHGFRWQARLPHHAT